MMNKYKYLALALVAMLSLAATARAAEDPEPAAPKHAVLENGRIDVYIGTPRVSDYQIGDSIPITVVFDLTPDTMWRARQKPPITVLPAQPAKAATEAPKDATGADVAKVQEPTIVEMPMIEVEGLKMSVLSNQPSDVEPLTPAKVETFTLPDGRKRLVAKFYVVSYVTTQKKQVGVVADFMYAIAKLPYDQPDWHSASTPELPVGITTAATENQTLLLEGDLASKASPKAPAAYWFLYGSLPFAAPLLGALLMLGFSRATRTTELTRNQQTWLVLDQVTVDAAAAEGFELEHYRRIFYAVREHLDVLGMDTTQTLDMLGRRSDLDHEAVAYVFNRETLFFDSDRVITTEKHDKLMSSIAVLIPRQ